MTQRPRPVRPLVLVIAALAASLIAGMLSWQPSVAVASFAFQSPPATPPPAPSTPPPADSAGASSSAEQPATPASEEATPERAEPTLPLSVEPPSVTPQNDLAPLLRSLVVAFGYVWLSCGVLILIAIPLFLFWLDRRGRDKRA